jgi:GNAT superfamily N-acetyltransferase
VDEVKRCENAEANDAAAIADSLASMAGRSAASSWPLAGGRLVITGDGFYVNRAIAVALRQPITKDDFDLLEERSRAAGVPPEVEACPWADPSLLALAAELGYRATWFRSVLIRELPAGSTSTPRSDVEIRPVDNARDFAAWHEVTVAGFELGSHRQQEVARQWGEALRRVDSGRLLIARLGGVPVGVASLAVRDGVALLGGMTTAPHARNQGVQQSLISFRLKRAGERGCAIAASSAAPGSGSERNLRRRGFEVAGTKIGLTQPASALPG